jgi:hypothetical protein
MASYFFGFGGNSASGDFSWELRVCSLSGRQVLEQLSVVSCRLSVFGFQFPVNSCQLSVNAWGVSCAWGGLRVSLGR